MNQRSYQGRPLVRPDEDVVDQGLGFDVATLMGRRQLLRTLGLGAAALGLAACSAGTASGTSSSSAMSASDSLDHRRDPRRDSGSLPG